MRRTLTLLGSGLLAAGLALAASAEAPAGPAGFQPSRRDAGDLIVLEVSGSYEQMGREQAELLGDDLRRVYVLQKADHDRAVASGGAGAAVLDAVGIPAWAAIGGAFDDSSLHDELVGPGLAVSARSLRNWACAAVMVGLLRLRSSQARGARRGGGCQ